MLKVYLEKKASTTGVAFVQVLILSFLGDTISKHYCFFFLIPSLLHFFHRLFPSLRSSCVVDVSTEHTEY